MKKNYHLLKDWKAIVLILILVTSGFYFGYQLLFQKQFALETNESDAISLCRDWLSRSDKRAAVCKSTCDPYKKDYPRYVKCVTETNACKEAYTWAKKYVTTDCSILR